jgi:alcohol dehydrogenase
MERYLENARKMLSDWKGNSYFFGFDVLGKVGDLASQYGKKAQLIMADLGEAWMAGIQKPVSDSLREKGVEFEAIAGARPNAPREDLYRLALHVARSRPKVIIAVGGGSPRRGQGC